MKKNKIKLLSFDFETSPAKGYFFGSIWETNIIEIIEYEQILCVAYMVEGSDVVYVKGQDDFKGYKKGILNDKALVEWFRPIIEGVDVVSAHNGDRFDLTVFNTRLIAHGLKPIPPTKSIDTKKIAKNKFHLPSNKLDDMADFLGIGRKLSTHKGLWLGCENGDKNSWKYMKQYCKNDVILQHKVMLKILPFTKQLNNYNNITGESLKCPNITCGSDHLQKRGFSRTTVSMSQRMQCQDCGTWSSVPIKGGQVR